MIIQRGTHMKRIVAIILSTAMLIALFSVSVFAETSVHIDFSLPAVGEAMIKSSDTIPAGEEVFCNLQSVYTGDIIDTILNFSNRSFCNHRANFWKNKQGNGKTRKK